MELLIGNDQTIELVGARDAVSGGYLNAATATATIKTKSGDTVAGPIAMDYVVASEGRYRGNIEDGVELTNNKVYVVEISIDAGADLIGLWREEIPAHYRRFSL